MSVRITTLLFALISSYTLFSQGYYIQNYNVDMVLQEDGSLDIVEEITVFFEEKRQGIIRDIPYQYKWEGNNIKIDITDINIPGYKSQISNGKGNKSIRIGTKGKFILGEHLYQIRYSVKGQITAYEDFLELYWNPIPEDWDTRIESYEYQLKFSTPLDLQFEDYRVWSGKQNSADNSATIQYVDNTLRGRGTSPLKANQGVTIAVKLPSDYVTVSLIAESAQSTQKKKRPINNDPWTWAISALAFLGLWSLRQKIDGNSEEEKTIQLEHYPPDDMSAAQVGYFIDHKANARDIMSLIPQWGAEGLIELKKLEDDTLIIKKQSLPAELPEYEHTLFNAIFKQSDRVNLSLLKYHLATDLYKAQMQLSKENKQSDLYDSTSVQYLHSWITLIGALAFTLFGILSIIFWMTIVLGASFILLGILLVIIYFSEAKHSAVGSRIKNHLLGLEQFLKNHDGSEYPMLMKNDPRYFDKMFPYAVALGIDTKFLERFSEQVDYDPQWYGYHNNIPASVIVSSPMKEFSENFDVKEITSVFSAVQTPEGSSGGGFSGGGSVGGGFGGGGGSSW